MQGAPTVGPLVAEGETVAANNVVTGPARIARADLEAGGEDDAVNLVLSSIDDNAVLGDALDTLSVGID